LINLVLKSLLRRTSGFNQAEPVPRSLKTDKLLEPVLAKEASQSSLIPQPDANVNLGDDNQEKEWDEKEQDKVRLRAKYISLAAQVRQFPEFQFKTNRVIDVGVILRSLKAGDNLGEAKLILTECDRIWQWHEDLPRDVCLRLAREYIREVVEKATELIQKHCLKNEAIELELVAGFPTKENLFENLYLPRLQRLSLK
jgi:hypothetical protein